MRPRERSTDALAHMLGFVDEAIALSEHRTLDDLATDRQFELAMLHLVTLVGESANRVAFEVQQEHPEVEWSSIIGMRHRIVHAYDRVDRRVLWTVLSEELAPLRAKLQAALAAISTKHP
jgi:uncharacterized protein with HEPN domain